MTTVSEPTVNGMIYYSSGSATVGLVVRNGIVVNCPPYAHKWAYGRNARDVWARLKRIERFSGDFDAKLAWIPDAEH